MEQLRLILEALHSFKRYDPPTHRTPIAIQTDAASNTVMKGAVLLFSVLVCSAALLYFTSEQNEWMLTAAKGIATGSALLVMISVLLTTVGVMVTLFNLGKESHADTTEASALIYTQAASLSQFSNATLQLAKRLIQKRIERLENKTSSLFGNTKLYALTSLLALSWKVYIDSESIMLFDKISTGQYNQYMGAIKAGGYFLLILVFGISVITFILKNIANRYRYQLEVVEFSELIRVLDASSEHGALGIAEPGAVEKMSKTL